jgi:hypothetical protein
MGIGCQAGQMIFGAGWLAAQGCGAKWALLDSFVFAPMTLSHTLSPQA